MPRKFELDHAYVLEGRVLNRFGDVSERLNDTRSMSWDDRRTLANLIDLSLMDVEKLGDDDA